MSRFNASEIAADVVRFGGPLIAVLSALENIPGVGLDVSGPAQGVIAAAVTILTAVLSVAKQAAVQEAVARTVVSMSHAKTNAAVSDGYVYLSGPKLSAPPTVAAKKPAAKKAPAKKDPAKKPAAAKKEAK